MLEGVKPSPKFMNFNSNRYGTDGDDVFDNRIDPVFNTFGGKGNDSFFSDEFSNFEGSAGNDTIVGGAAGVTALYWDSPSAIQVDLLAGFADDGWGTRDVLRHVTCIQATSFGDTLLGDAYNNQFWPAGGDDLIDGRGGVDLITIMAHPESVRWSRIGEDWVYECTDSAGRVISSSTVRNVELVNYYYDGNFSSNYRLRSGQSAPEATKFDASIPQLDRDLLAPSNWKVAAFDLAVTPVNEPYPAYYYPTSADYHDPGIFNPNPHNAVVGDFNGDGKEDIWVSWVAFPHTVVRQTVLAPTVLMGSDNGLLALPASSVPSSLDRHMAYRTMAADFNGDGIDDVAFGGMGVITRLPDGGYTNVWERNGLALFNETKIIDATSLLQGQEPTADLTNWGFAHDGSAGDINGDGRADLYTGGRLWVSNAGGSWDLATQYLPPAVPTNPPMSSAIGDLDGDNRLDIAVFWPDFGNQAYAVMSNGKAYPDFTAVALPPLLFGNNSKANNCAIADLDGNGLGDIIVATTRALPYYLGAALQLLMQTSPGQFEDQTASRLDNSASDLAQGEGQLRIVDVNGDGLLDIVHSLDSRGANIFLNDGSGHFTLFDLSSFPFVQSSQVEGLQSARPNFQVAPEKLFPIDINGDGLSDFLSYLVLGDYETHAGNIAVLYTVLSNEMAWGRDKSETLNGTTVADHIRGYSGNDSLTGHGGNDTLDGGAGTDSATWSGPAANYELGFAGGCWSVRDRSAVDGIDTLINVEELRFTDKTVTIESATPDSYADLPSSLYHFCVVAFGAAPGVEYMNQLASAYHAKLSVKEIVNIFTTKPQFTSSYAESMSNADLARLLVANVVRNSASETAKAEAIKDINGALDSGWSRGDMIYTVFGNLAAMALDDPGWGHTAQQFLNQTTVARYYTEIMNQSTTDMPTLRSVLASVDQNTDLSMPEHIAALIGVELMALH